MNIIVDGQGNPVLMSVDGSGNLILGQGGELYATGNRLALAAILVKNISREPMGKRLEWLVSLKIDEAWTPNQIAEVTAKVKEITASLDAKGYQW